MAFRPVKQYVIDTSTSASSAFSLTHAKVPIADQPGPKAQVRIHAVDADCVVKFGDNAVAASDTVSSGALPDGNFHVPEGAIEIFDLSNTDLYISTKATGTGKLYVCLGYGEKI